MNADITEIKKELLAMKFEIENIKNEIIKLKNDETLSDKIYKKLHPSPQENLLIDGKYRIKGR